MTPRSIRPKLVVFNEYPRGIPIFRTKGSVLLGTCRTVMKHLTRAKLAVCPNVVFVNWDGLRFERNAVQTLGGSLGWGDIHV